MDRVSQRTFTVTAGLTVIALSACRPVADETAGEADTNPASAASAAASVAPDATQPPASTIPEPAVGAGGVLPLLEQLRVAPTAREWASNAARLASLELNDVDPFYELPPIIGVSPFWCLRAIQADTLETGGVQRTYYFFYHDEPRATPPNDFALPTLSPGIEYQLSRCSLRAVAAEMPDADAESVLGGWRQRHDSAFGPATEVSPEALPYGLRPDGRLTWVNGDVAVGAGMGVTGAPVAMAALPIPAPGRTGWDWDGPRFRGTRAWRSDLLDLALEAAELPSETRAAIATVRAAVNPGAPPPRELVLGVLGELVERPAALGPGDAATDRYAARLTAADLLLLAHYRYIPRPDDLAGFTSVVDATAAAAAAFNELGANYYYTELEYETMYFGALGDSAAALPSSPGGWGDLGRLGNLEQGCDWVPTLEVTAELLPQVTEPAIRARLHYLRAEALSSILEFYHLKQLRAGVVDDIEALRREALEHYRAALDGGLGAEDRDVAWALAWSVAMNEPLSPRYDCRRA